MNDPITCRLEQLESKGLAKVVEMNGVGCEKFAEHVSNYVVPGK